MSIRICTLIVLGLVVDIASSQLPNPSVNNIFPAGGQVGSEVEITVSGRDLDELTRIQFSHPGIQGHLKKTPTEFEPEKVSANQFVVQIADNVPVGVYEAHVVGRFGASTPRSFVVSAIPFRSEASGNNSLRSAQEIPLDSVICGRADANAVDYYKVKVAKGESLNIVCNTQILDSPVRPLFAIHAANGKTLARNKSVQDDSIRFEVVEDGDYVISVYDHLFAGGGNHSYLLSIRTGPLLDFVLPPAAPAGQITEVTVFGRGIPGGEASRFEINKQPLQKKKLQVYVPPQSNDHRFRPDSGFASLRSGFEFQLQAVDGLSDSLPVGTSRERSIVESEPNDRSKPEKIELPVEYSGTLYPRRDEDWVEFTAKKGQPLHVEVISHRMGAMVDPAVYVWHVTTDGSGNTKLNNIKATDDRSYDQGRYQRSIPRGFDYQDNDPVVRFDAPQDGTYRVSIRDLYGNARTDPRSVYRLIISKPRPDFQLIAWPQYFRKENNNFRISAASPSIRPGETSTILVDAIRSSGFSGDIRISVGGLPESVKCPDVVLMGNQTEAILLLTADDDAKPWSGEISITGSADVAGMRTSRVARTGVLTSDTGDVKGQRPKNRYCRSLVFAVSSADKPPAIVQFDSNQVFRTSIGGVLKIPVKLSTNATLKGDLKLRPIGAPGNLNVKEVVLKKDGTEGTLEIAANNPKKKPAPGTHRFYLVGEVTVNCPRNSGLIVSAEKRKAEFASTLSAAVEAEKKAIGSRDEAKKLLDDFNTQVQQLQESASKAQADLQSTRNQIAEVEKELAIARQSADSSTESASKVAEIESRKAELANQFKNLEASVNEQQAKLTETQTQIESSRQALVDAEQHVQAATQRKQRTEQHSKAIEDQLNAAKKNHGPRDFPIHVSSNYVNVEIVASPVVTKLSESRIELTHNGSKLDAKIGIAMERNYGFGDVVDFELVPPKDQPGFSSAKLQIAKDQKQGEITFSVAPDVKPGEYRLSLHSKLKFGGIDIQDSKRITVAIQ